jgi:hypothetical protein
MIYKHTPKSISRYLRLKYLSYYETNLESLYSRIYALATAGCSIRLQQYLIIRLIDSGKYDIETYSKSNQSVTAARILELMRNES